MAIRPQIVYPAQTLTSDPTGYPHGKARNDVLENDGQGTPLEQTWVNDLFGFEQALLAKAGLTPSGTPDSAAASQYVQAISILADRRCAEMAACNWTKRSPAGGFSNAFYATVWGEVDGQAVAVGENATIQRSVDGSTWSTVAAAGGYTQSFWGLCRNGTFLVVVGASGEIQTSSNNGATWTHRTQAAPFTGVFLDVCSSGSLYVAVGEAGEIQTSPDGVNWTHRAAALGYAGAWESVAAYSGLIVAVGASGEVQTSPDGITWTHRASAITTTIYDVVWTGVIFVASGDFGQIATSPNGVDWTKRIPDPNNTDDFRSVGWSGRRLITVGIAGKIYTSLSFY